MTEDFLRSAAEEALDHDYWEEFDDEPVCHYCRGEKVGAYGVDWDNPDPLWYIDGEVITCPCCLGSGLAKDCRFW